MKIVKLLSLLALGTSLAGSAFAQDKLELKISEIWGDDYPTTMGLRVMADEIAKNTNGRITVTVYPNGTLGSEKEVTEQVRMGALAMARIPNNLLNNVCEETAIPSLPFLFKSADHLHKVLDSDVGKELMGSCDEKGYVGLAYYDSGSRSIYSKKPIKTLADAKGLKLRVQQSDLMVAMVKAMGGNATPMPMGEVYTALKTGVIDAAENNWPSYESGKHFEVARYYNTTEHLMNPEIVIISKIIWDKISPEDQKIIRDAAYTSAVAQRKFWADREKVSKDIVLKDGITLVEANKEEFQKAMVPVYEEFVKSPRMKEMVAKIQAID
ncbi:MAG: TRAP transporter substrate-binding protein [Methylobacteriaceae bacterium]|jgi:tripartite ATP-independent transporter DctP family solute receptor|nr:TRAP transporter substrate-binding protein [Methylobacteriaceae bacterium]